MTLSTEEKCFSLSHVSLFKLIDFSIGGTNHSVSFGHFSDLYICISRMFNLFSARYVVNVSYTTFEPPRGKTNNLHIIYAKTKTQINFAVTAKLISAFVFATRIVHSLFFLNPKFQASSMLLCLYRPVCARPVREPHCWFSHEAAHL